MTTSNMKATIQCDIHKVWKKVLAVEHYHTWRNDVSRIEMIDEKHFMEYTRDGYGTEITFTVDESNTRVVFDMENSHIKGRWVVAFASEGSETEIDFTAYVTAKQLFMRPTGKSVFEKTYLKKEQAQFVMDLKKSLTLVQKCQPKMY